MALSGTINGTTANDKVIAKIQWSAVQNSEGNYSIITATLMYSRTNTGYTTGGYWSGGLSIGDKTKTDTGKYIEIEKDSDTVAITYTEKVEHAADGTLSVKISATGKIPGSTLSSTTVGATVTLDTIPRASNIISAGNLILGNACSVRWIPNSSAFWYKLKFYLGNWSYTTEAIHPNKTSAYTYTDYKIPLDAAKQITGDKEATMTVTLTTYPDSGCTTSIGSDSELFGVTVPENADTQPTVTMTLTPVSALEGLYIQGLSRVQATISAEPKLGADIESCNMMADGRSYESPFISDYLTECGAVEITGCAEDSRGIFGYATQTVTVLPYYRPRLTGVAAYRCNSDGEYKENGEYLKIEATRDYAQVISHSGQNNFCTIQYRYKEENADKYSDPVTILEAEAEGNSVVTNALLNGEFYNTVGYTVQIIAVDTIGQSQNVTVSIPSERVFRHKPAGGKGLGLGGYCNEDDLLDVHWNQRIRKNLQVDGSMTVGGRSLLDRIYPVGSIYMSVTQCDPAELFGGTWERLKDRFLLGAGDAYKGGTEGGTATVTLTTKEMPEHDHEVKLMVSGYEGWGEYTSGAYGLVFDYENDSDGVLYHGAGAKIEHAAVVSGNCKTGMTGSGAAHSNMPPYLAVYMYKRIA